MAATFGLDFGTTNSLVTVIRYDDEVRSFMPASFTQTQNGMPHPSVVSYAGGQPVVGRRAMDQLGEPGLGVFGDIVRSPKSFLGSPTGIYVGGVTRQAADVVADVLLYLRQDALGRGYQDNKFDSAIVTIPVTMQGRARAELRQAAHKAGFTIQQFVHEPLAALYGYLRAKSDFRQELANLEDRLVLVFDWGGGTLDLTLCQLRQGVLTQILNEGDREVGGDNFDRRLRRLIREKHAALYPAADWGRLQPSADSRLIRECERAKISLSSRPSTIILLTNLLASSGPEKDVELRVTKEELDEAVRDLVTDGLNRIEVLLENAGVDRGAIEFCLATGGMVSMPAIQDGLREIFGLQRLRLVENAASIISEGAAWIVHDGVGLRLAKPLELLLAGDSYIALFPAGTDLPGVGMSGSATLDLYCVDPSDGFAKFLFARPAWPGRESPSDKRIPYRQFTLLIDHRSKPLLERLKVKASINDDLIVEIRASSIIQTTSDMLIEDLEFGLSVGPVADQ
jgi:molecular chaperone DnaK (HSP70)